MKKIVLTVAIVLMGVQLMSAEKRTADTRFNLNVDATKLENYLGLDELQTSQVSEIGDYFTCQLSGAKYVREEKRAKRVQEAVYGNLKLMKGTLNQEQYAKYLRLMNVTLKNRGLDQYLVER